MKDLGEKLTEEDKSQIQPMIDNIKTALAGTDTNAIKEATETLTQKFYELSSKLYQQPEQGANPEGQKENSDGTDNSDYKVVDEDEKK
jgi:molecular chaperone DnaK